MAHPYIDIAVLDRVRERLTAGDAVLVLTPELDSVLFANAAGARLAGHDNPIDVTGQDPDLGAVAKRQIAANAGHGRSAEAVTLALRLNAGISSRTEMVRVEPVILPDQSLAILLSAATSGGIANAISGLGGDGTHAAVVSLDGLLLAASERIDDLGLEQPTMAALAREAAGESDRMVKRRIRTETATHAAGIGRISDEPARFLLLIVEGKATPVVEILAPAAQEAPAPEAEPTQPDASKQETPPAFGKRVAAPAATLDRWYFHGDRFAGAATVGTPTREQRQSAAEGGSETHQPANSSSPDTPGGTATPALETELSRVAPDPKSAPVRFTWKIDAAGYFRAVSGEFGAAVGQHAADIEGRTFDEVAAVFGLDPSGDIRDLLDRHDTWSGRSVLWPIEGTDLRAPIDLAALPVYDRERRFDGFRGFGIVRLADAVIDPEAIGLALVRNGAQPDASGDPDLADNDGGYAAPSGDRDEPPALMVADLPEAPASSDKVIRLEERRAGRERGDDDNGSGKLTPIERSAFREIAERLRREGLIATPAADAAADEDLAAQAAIENSLPAALPETGDLPPFAGQPEISDRSGDLPATLDMSEDRAEAPVEDMASDAVAAAGRGDDVFEAPSEEDEAELGDLARLDEPAPEEDSAETVAVAGSAMPEDAVGEPAGNGAILEEAPILSRLPVPLLIHNGGDVLFANQAFFDLTGYGSLDHFREAGGLDRLFVHSNAQQPGESTRLNTQLRTAYDETVTVRAHLHSVPWKDGHALLLSIRPLEAGQAAEEGDIGALKQEVAELASVLETATDGVVFINPDGTIRGITQSAEALFSFDPAEVMGKPFSTLFATESQKAVSDYLANLSGTGVASLLNDGREVIGREAHGRFVPLFMTLGKLADSSGFCAVLRDITQWKRAEEELNAARRAAEYASSQKSEFLARVSHEIRTPLNAIIGFSDLMTEERFGPVGNLRYLDYLRDINRSGRHVLDLVNDLLDISKIEAGQQEMDFEAVSLNEALSEAVSIMQPQANRNRVIIRSSFATDLPEVVADLRSVKQIALNLLSNAVHYTAAGGQVIVSTAYELTGGVTIRVRDTGIGMTAQEIEQAMKPFKQVNALNRARGEGTGLGLPLTKAMVEANRANFVISSTPGQGTMVEITFPSTRVLAD